jgi:hypothetical protein
VASTVFSFSFAVFSVQCSVFSKDMKHRMRCLKGLTEN